MAIYWSASMMLQKMQVNTVEVTMLTKLCMKRSMLSVMVCIIPLAERAPPSIITQIIIQTVLTMPLIPLVEARVVIIGSLASIDISLDIILRMA